MALGPRQRQRRPRSARGARGGTPTAGRGAAVTAAGAGTATPPHPPRPGTGSGSGSAAEPVQTARSDSQDAASGGSDREVQIQGSSSAWKEGRRQRDRGFNRDNRPGRSSDLFFPLPLQGSTIRGSTACDSHVTAAEFPCDFGGGRPSTCAPCLYLVGTAVRIPRARRPHHLTSGERNLSLGIYTAPRTFLFG